MHRQSINERFEETILHIAHCLFGEQSALPSLEKLRIHAASLKPRSVKAIESDLRGWGTWWSQSGKGKPIHDADSLGQFFEYLASIGRQPGSIYRSASSVKCVLASLGLMNAEARSVIQRVCRSGVTSKQQTRWRPLRATPLSGEHIRAFLSVVDTQVDHEVHCAAALLVMYESAARVDQLFGHKELGDWHLPPASAADIRKNADGTGSISLRSVNEEIARREAHLSELTMAWMSLSLQRRQGGAGALFVSRRGTPMRLDTWSRNIRKIMVRAGLDPERFSCSSPRLGVLRDLLARGSCPEDVRRASGWGQMDSVIRLLRQTSASPSERAGDAPRQLAPRRTSHSTRGRSPSGGGRKAILEREVPIADPVQLTPVEFH